MIEEFFLPDWTGPAEKNVDFPGRDTLDGMHDLRQAEVPSIHISKRAQQEMSMIWHEHRSMQVELVIVFPQAPAVVCGESDEDGPMVFLDLGKTRRYLYFGGIKSAALWAAWRVVDRSHTGRSASTAQLLGQQLIHQLRIRLALRSFHHLADEEAHDCLLPCAVLLNLFRIGRDSLIDDLLER